MLKRLISSWWHGVFQSGPSRADVGDVLERAHRMQAAGDTDAARRILEEGVRRAPAQAELWNNLGVLHLARSAFALAERHFRRALELDPRLAQAHCNLGIALSEQGRPAEAKRSFQRAIEIAPGLLAARENLAKLLGRQIEEVAALAAWNEVLRLDPDHAEAHAAVGLLRMRAGLFDEARALFARARTLGIDTPHIALNEALVEAAVGDPVAARRAIASLRGRVEEAEIDWNLALIHLSRGEFAEGWPLYEARLRRSFESPRRSYPFPEWNGDALGPGALLVMAEQGLGDEIMFASCYPDVLPLAPGCVIECDPRLAGLFARSFPAASVIGAPRGNDRRWLERYPSLRSQIHAGSLPRWFRTSAERFPRRPGYLRPEPQRVEAWLSRLSGRGGRLNVGIAWNGGLVHTRRALRSIALPELAPLLRGSEHVFVSLQHDDDGTEAAQLAALSGTAVQRFPEALQDLDETAALLRALDVVITVCSSIVHLSGAVGAATWVLTPRVAEWRYLRTGGTLPWYSDVKLFRQRRQGEWPPVVSDLVGALRAHAARTVRSTGGK